MDSMKAAEMVLITHQRHRGGCLCGWAELGKSLPGHQAAMLREAGLLADKPDLKSDVPAEVPTSVDTVRRRAAMVLQRGREFAQREDRDLDSAEAAEKTTAYLKAVEDFCAVLPADDSLPPTATLDQVHVAAVRYAAAQDRPGEDT